MRTKEQNGVLSHMVLAKTTDGQLKSPMLVQADLIDVATFTGDQELHLVANRLTKPLRRPFMIHTQANLSYKGGQLFCFRAFLPRE